MKLSLEGLKDTKAWQAAGISLPSYDVAQFRKEPERRRSGFILESAIFSVFSSEVLRIRCSPEAVWIPVSSARRHLIMIL